MSYDLVVFEKKKVPTDTKEFLEWYEKQTEWSDDLDYNDVAHASPNLQQFFQELKEIFPPMNGRFAPSDEELSSIPGLEDRLCDYCIGKDIIYLAFSYSISEQAYSIVKRAAFFHHVGFFDTGYESSPFFFDSPYPMLLEGQWFHPMQVSDFDSIEEKLRNMTTEKRSYLYLTDQTDSYIQVGGYGDAFTVEKREYIDAMHYTHKKAEYSLAEHTAGDSYVLIAGNRVKLKPQQLLSNDTVTQLFLDFFQKTQTADAVIWTDMDI